MAMFLGTIVVIEYPSAFTLLQKGRRLIKCFQRKKRGTLGEIRWEVVDGVVQDNESLECLKRAVVNKQETV